MSILNLNEIVNYLDELDSCREKLLKISRDIIRYSKKIIHSIQQEEFSTSEKLIREMTVLKEEFMRIASKVPRLYHSNMVCNVLVEYVESYVVYTIVTRGKVPLFRDLNVEPIPYILGVLEDLDRADRVLNFMEGIYMELSVLNYPDSILPGFRRKCDLVRRMLDDTKNVLIFARGCEDMRKLAGGGTAEVC